MRLKSNIADYPGGEGNPGWVQVAMKRTYPSSFSANSIHLHNGCSEQTGECACQSNSAEEERSSNTRALSSVEFRKVGDASLWTPTNQQDERARRVHIVMILRTGRIAPSHAPKKKPTVYESKRDQRHVAGFMREVLRCTYGQQSGHRSW